MSALGACLCAGAIAAPGSFPITFDHFHRAWQSEEGLPQNSAQAVIQTRDGYLWIGTQDGLARFDGMRFTVFNTRTVSELKSHSVTALLEDDSGTLWIGTDGGGLTWLKNGVFTYCAEAEGAAGPVVRTFYKSADGAVWIGSSTGLARFQEGKFTRFSTADGLAHDAVRAVKHDREGDLWVATGKGLNRFQGGIIAVDNAHTHSMDFALALYEDRDGGLWAGGGAGLAHLMDGRETRFTREDGLSDNVVNAIYQDGEGTLWVGTYNGLNRRKADGSFVEVTSEGVPYDLVYSISEDREGNLWVGTKDGLNRINPRPIAAYTRQHGLTHNAAVSVLEDKSGTIWISTWGGGLNMLRDGKLSRYTNAFARELILSVHEGRDGSLWVGTDYSAGLFHFKDGRRKRYGVKEGLADSALTVIHEDRRGSVWIGSSTALNVLRQGVFSRFTTENGLAGNRIRLVHEDRQGRIWIGTEGGLSRWEDGGFVNYTRREGLSHDAILCLHEDAEGVLWIGTEGGGLNRFQDGEFVSLASDEGALSERFLHILEDDAGYFWMSSRKGIFRASRTDLDRLARGETQAVPFDHFGRIDGMASGRCNGTAQPSGWKARDGRLWFPTIKGVVVIDPARVSRNELPPPVLIEGLVVDRTVVPLQQNALRLPPGKGEIAIAYTALSFRRPEEVAFKYKLEGFDADWIDAGNRRSAYYSNLAPGEYEFRVMACNDAGIWNEAGGSLAFSLAPRFYSTVWFYGLCFVSLALTVIGFHRLRVRQMRRRERELVRLVDQHTAKLKETVQSLESFCFSIAHDLRTPLRAMQGLTTMLQEDYGNALDDIGRDYARRIVTASKRMDDLIQDLLTYGRLSQMEITFCPVELSQVFDSVLADLDEEIKVKEAVLVVSHPLPKAHSNPVVLKQVLANVVSNALKFVDSGVAPQIHVWGEAGRRNVRVWIQDNGIGIDPAYYERIFNVFERLHASDVYPGTGIGLAIARKGVERMNGRISVASEPGKGSMFCLEIPAALEMPMDRDPCKTHSEPVEDR